MDTDDLLYATGLYKEFIPVDEDTWDDGQLGECRNWGTGRTYSRLFHGFFWPVKHPEVKTATKMDISRTDAKENKYPPLREGTMIRFMQGPPDTIPTEEEKSLPKTGGATELGWQRFQALNHKFEVDKLASSFLSYLTFDACATLASALLIMLLRNYRKEEYRHTEAGQLY
ncbi:MAG: hypothetical protein GY799_16330, partial [Desulfobulbaceae bacterium]|nr:hypothetical protein [Desulfobulbaceae bacterium]